MKQYDGRNEVVMIQNDTVEETQQNTSDSLTDGKSRFKALFQTILKYWNQICAVTVVILSYIQYSYRIGVCLVYGLPLSAVSLQLTDFVPTVIILCCIVLYAVDCYISLNPIRMKFSLFRMVCGTLINYCILNLILEGGSQLLFLVISIIPPAIIEYLFVSGKMRKIVDGIVEKYKKSLKSDEGRLFYRYFIKPCIVFFMILALLIPVAGVIATYRKKAYEICRIEENTYAVVLSYSSNAYIQPAEIDGDSLTINTNCYKSASKDDIQELVFRSFNHVTIAPREEQ